MREFFVIALEFIVIFAAHFYMYSNFTKKASRGDFVPFIISFFPAIFFIMILNKEILSWFESGKFLFFYFSIYWCVCYALLIHLFSDFEIVRDLHGKKIQSGLIHELTGRMWVGMILVILFPVVGLLVGGFWLYESREGDGFAGMERIKVPKRRSRKARLRR